MTQYYVQRERTNDYTVRATNGQNSWIIASYTNKRAAQFHVDRLNVKTGR